MKTCQENLVKNLRKVDGEQSPVWLKESFQGPFLFYSTVLCLFSGKPRENRIVICNHFSWTVTWILDILDSALSPPQPLFWQLSLLRWFITPWSPRSCQSAAPGAPTQPHKEGCGDTQAAEGLARLKFSVTACVCCLRTWMVKQEKKDVQGDLLCTLSTDCATSASDVGCLRCVCVTDRERRGRKSAVAVQ